MPAKSYKELLLPAEGEDKAAYLARVTQAKAAAGSTKDRALLTVSQAMAVAWNAVDNKPHPLEERGMPDVNSAADILQASAVQMARAPKEATPKLDTPEFTDKHFREKGVGRAIARQVGRLEKTNERMREQKTVQLIGGLRDVLDGVIESLPEMGADPRETQALEQMKELQKDLKELKRKMHEGMKK